MNRIAAILLISSAFIIGGCVSIFSSKTSVVSVNSSTQGASIYHRNKLLGKGNSTSKFLKEDYSQELVLKKEGYLDKHHAFNVQKKNPLRFANIISIPTLYGAYIVYGIDGSSSKRFQYNRYVKVPEMVKEPAKRGEDQKFLQINYAALNIKKEDTFIVRYKSEKTFLAKQIYSVENPKEDITYDQTKYTATLSSFLKKYNFIDTTESIFPNYHNTSYIESIIEKVKFHTISSRKQSYYGGYGDVLYAETQIKWIILDYYRVKQDSITLTVNSDFFQSYDRSVLKDSKDDDEVISGYIKALNNSVELSLVKLLTVDKFKNLIKKTSEDKKYTSLKLRCDRYNTKSLNDLIQAAVTVKTGKNSHGSGFLISQDGYIVTNYHVIANCGKKVSVILNNGAKYDATIERTSPTCDLALLKINGSMMPHMQIKKYPVKDIQLGTDVATIGTPTSVELGQSVAKGIVSGTRKPQDITYIQTNIAVNPGNSGGAFLNTNGEVLGVVTSKLVGVGIEGIAFVIPSEYIFDALKLEY